ncbi:MAG: sulfotransferase [Planctomycetes bacterium]|nr:sulfotransferase [Planctomycetota bacterium]
MHDCCRWDAPVLVVGAPRSGTTRLTRALARHPQLAITNEAHVLPFLRTTQIFAGLPVNQALDDGPLHLLGLINPRYQVRFARLHLEHVRALIRDFYRAEFADRRFIRFGDKIVFGAQVMSDLATAFPGVQFVHVVRDPRDAVLSMWRFQRRLAGDYEHVDLHGFEALCHHWAALEEQLAPVLVSSDSLCVRYERLVAEPVQELHAVERFLGVAPATTAAEAVCDTSPAVLDGHATSSSPRRSVGRWRRELDADQVATVERVCGPAMQRLGYEPTAP